MTELEYITYFEGLATQHKQIGHRPDESHFLYLGDDDDFARVEAEVRNRLTMPALVLDPYTDSMPAGDDNPRLKVMGGFSILCSGSERDRIGRREARQQAQQLARSVLRRIRHDCVHPTGTLYLRKVKHEADYEGGAADQISGTVGWGYEIVFMVPHSMAVTVSEWSDLAPA
jgi:hypothetical protein